MKKVLIPLSFLLVFCAWAQNGTPHGNFVSWKASTTSGVTYNLYRCAGTCTAMSSWTKIASGISGTSYLDGASGLTAGNTYSYAATAFDGTNESAFSNISVISDSAFPANPGPPSGCNAAQQ